MMGRPRKLTLDEDARPEQRELTKKMVEQQKDQGKLPLRPPTYLKGFARKAWKTIVPMLNETDIVSAADVYTVRLLCEQLEMEQKAYLEIQENGIQTKIYKTVVTPLGEVKGKDFVGFRRNPSTLILSDSTNKIKMQCDALGLTPQSRAKMLAMIKPDEDGEETVADLIDSATKGDDF